MVAVFIMHQRLVPSICCMDHGVERSACRFFMMLVFLVLGILPFVLFPFLGFSSSVECGDQNMKPPNHLGGMISPPQVGIVSDLPEVARVMGSRLYTAVQERDGEAGSQFQNGMEREFLFFDGVRERQW